MALPGLRAAAALAAGAAAAAGGEAVTVGLMAEASLAAFEVAKLKLECRDLHPQCLEFGGVAECPRNPRFMHAQCARTCGTCSAEGLLRDAQESLRYALRAAAVALPKQRLAAGRLLAQPQLGPDALHLAEQLAEELRAAPAMEPITHPVADLVQMTAEAAARLPDAALPARLSPTATAKLASGWTMPLLGFGTWMLQGRECEQAVLWALEAGYRLLDGAEGYHNDREIGVAMRQSGVPRSEIFLADKLSSAWGAQQARQMVLKQLQDLGTDYFDLYYLHSPHQDLNVMRETWHALEQLVDEGKIRSLGASNFDLPHLDALKEFARHPISALQNKLSPYRPGTQSNPRGHDFLRHCRDRNVQLVGYSVVNPWPGQHPPLQDAVVKRIAEEKQRTAAQVLNRWALQLGAAVIPRSRSRERIRENAELFDFSLSPTEMVRISALQWMVYVEEQNWPAAANVYGVDDKWWVHHYMQHPEL